METTRNIASMIVPALLACAVCGCASDGGVSEPLKLSEDASETTEATETSMTPEEFVAGQNLSGSTAPDPANDVVCRREKPVGSHFAKTVCFSRAEKKREEENARDFMKAMPPRSVIPNNN